jgi:signal transduction histidine kinase
MGHRRGLPGHEHSEISPALLKSCPPDLLISGILPNVQNDAIIVPVAIECGNTFQVNKQEEKPDYSRIEQISHDFRSPLNVIIGFTELLLDESPGKINKEQRRALKDILNSGYRLLALADKIFVPSSPDLKKILHR